MREGRTINKSTQLHSAKIVKSEEKTEFWLLGMAGGGPFVGELWYSEAILGGVYMQTGRGGWASGGDFRENKAKILFSINSLLYL